jgi:RNA polymerase sigma-70 factor (ECF subfamily)
MVAVLTGIFGTENLETAEDVVQQTFIDAISVWKIKGVPDNPSGWLFRVAKNKAIDIIRRNKYSVQFDFSDSDRKLLASEYTLAVVMENLWKEDLVKDDMLRMMFACCQPGLSEESQITLILKTLCGFSTSEIAKAFLTSEDTVSKRLYRTKEFFRAHKAGFAIPSASELESRVHAVLNSIYLLFNEGYNSQTDQLIREDLIDEAMLLCKLVTENRYTQIPAAYALMALMCFHSARNKARLSMQGDIILLPVQDRSKWDKELIYLGNEYMNKAAFGDQITNYHLEAAIAYEHCTAKTYDRTNWPRILELYEWLCTITPSPVSEMNKAVAVMQVHGPACALDNLIQISQKTRLDNYYLYHSLLGEIYSRLGNSINAKEAYEKAISLTRSETERNMLKAKIGALLS